MSNILFRVSQLDENQGHGIGKGYARKPFAIHSLTSVSSVTTSLTYSVHFSKDLGHD